MRWFFKLFERPIRPGDFVLLEGDLRHPAVVREINPTWNTALVEMVDDCGRLTRYEFLYTRGLSSLKRSSRGAWGRACLRAQDAKQMATRKAAAKP